MGKGVAYTCRELADGPILENQMSSAHCLPLIFDGRRSRRQACALDYQILRLNVGLLRKYTICSLICTFPGEYVLERGNIIVID